MMNSFCYSSAYQELYNICDCNCFGIVIGAGIQSVVIEPFNEWNVSNIENPVLIITKEKEKFSFLEALFSDTEAKVERIYKGMYDIELIKLLKSEGWDIFYSTKMEPIKFDFKSCIGRSLESLSNTSYGIAYSFSHNFPAEYLINELMHTIEFFSDKLSKEVTDIEYAFIEAIKKAFYAVKKLNITKEFIIDLHTEQFVKYGNQIFCIDSFLFDKSLLK